MKTMTTLKLLAALWAGVFLPTIHLSAADSPALIPFQGRLTDADGQNVSDGAKVVQFKIYDAPVGGTAVWGGEVHKLSVNEGLVNTVLGTKSSLDAVDFDGVLYLEITVDANDDESITLADPPLLPRQSILPSIFAKKSADSELLAGYDWGPLFGNNNPVDGTINVDKIAPQSIHTELLAPNSVILSLLAKEVLDNLMPAGSITAFAGPPGNIPDGWLLCDGSGASSADNPRLFSAIGTSWGNGSNDADGATDFNLPDLRGRFLRGVTGGSSLDPDAAGRGANRSGGNSGNNVGSIQSDNYPLHRHTYSGGGATLTAGNHSHPVKLSNGTTPVRWGTGAGTSTDRIDNADASGTDSLFLATSNAGSHEHAFLYSGSTSQQGSGTETRPENAYVNYIIKL